jgi:hypothetical protein
MNESPDVVAHVMFRSAAGDRPGIDVPISSGTIDRLRPAPEAVAAVVEHLGRVGFTVLDRGAHPGISIGFSGPRELFEQHFGVELVFGAERAYKVRRTRRSAKAAPSSRRAVDATDVSLDRLPLGIRHVISAIALEDSMALDEGHFDV